MPYDATPDPYVNPATGVMYNLLNIEDGEELNQAEADITAVIIATLAERPVPGDFDFAHYKDIHDDIFNAIYPWAGQIRNRNISKDGTIFASPDVIESVANTLFSKLRSKNLLKGLSDDEYVRELAHYYSEINVLHPFREGNGRTERAFFEQLILESNRRIDWTKMDPQENVEACIAGYKGDELKLVVLLKRLMEG